MKVGEIRGVDVVVIKNPLNFLALSVKNIRFLSNREKNLIVTNVTIDGKTAICTLEV